jgi:hypothetical protein
LSTSENNEPSILSKQTKNVLNYGTLVTEKNFTLKKGATDSPETSIALYS